MARKEINGFYHKPRLKDSIFDLFSAPRYALKFQIIFTSFIGIALSYFVLMISSFFIMKLFGKHYQSFHFIGLIPFAIPSVDLPLLANFILIIGYSISLSLFFATTLGISVQAFEVLKGTKEFIGPNIIEYIKNNFFNLFFLPFSFFIIILTMISIISALLLFLKIPFIGHYLSAIIIPITWIIMMVVLFSLIAAMNSILFFPAVTILWDTDIKGIVFQAFSIIWTRPWMIIGGILISIWNFTISFLGAISIFIGSFWMLNRLFSILSIFHLKHTIYDISSFILNSMNSLPQFVKFEMIERAIIFWYFIFFIIAIAYAVSSFTISQMILFIRLKKAENDVDLLKIS
ncbi:MAG: hypothetical protein ACE5D7_01880 [Fidelibacterota bacterium]